MMKRETLLRRLFLVAGMLILFLIVFGFSNRIAEFTRLNAQLERESARVTELIGTQAALQAEIAYATSEAAVEEWAREEGRWAQNGDYAVIPLPLPGVSPQEAAEAQPTQETLSNWQTWIEWFFYDGP